jgi:hypothetical protein
MAGVPAGASPGEAQTDRDDLSVQGEAAVVIEGDVQQPVNRPPAPQRGQGSPRKLHSHRLGRAGAE